MNNGGNRRRNNNFRRHNLKRKSEYDNDYSLNNKNKRRFTNNEQVELNQPTPSLLTRSRFEPAFVNVNDSRPHTITNVSNDIPEPKFFTNNESVKLPINNFEFQSELPSKSNLGRYSANNRLKAIRANVENGSKPYARTNNSELLNRNSNLNYKVVTYNNPSVRPQSIYNSNTRSINSYESSNPPQKYSANDRLLRYQRNLQCNESNNKSQFSVTTVENSLHIVKPSSLEERLKNFKRNYENNGSVPSEELAEILEEKPVTPVVTPTRYFANTSSNSVEQIDESMDCSPIDEKEVLSNLQNLRKNENTVFKPQTQLQEIIASVAEDIQVNKSLYKTIYIVVDTNIFISHLNLIKRLMTCKLNRVVAPVIFVPWIVIQELDHLKDGKSGDKLKTQARAAVHFINNQLTSKSVNLRGQSVKDAFKVNLSSNNADDGVLHCAMQIVENGEHSYLLSNDTNLRNKAMINGIDACSHETIFKKIDPYYEISTKSLTTSFENDSLKNIKTPLSHLFSYIIVKEMKKAYGKAWNKMISSPPWTVKECLDLFKKYWQSVFSCTLQKQCQNTIDKFIKILESEGNSNEFNEKLVEIAFALCIYLKNGFVNYVDSVNECITLIEQETSSKTV